MNRAVFFDRDGVINELVQRDGGYFSPRSVDEFKLITEAELFIQFAKSRNYLCIVISNQPDIARGLLNPSELDKMTKVMLKELALDDVLYCTHDDPDDKGCRKPAPGLIHQAQTKWNIDLTKSVLVGDTWKDVEAACNAGVKMFLLDREYNQDLTYPNRIDSLKRIIQFLS